MREPCWDIGFHFLTQFPRIEALDQRVDCVRNCQAFFQSDYTCFHPHQQRMRVAVALLCVLPSIRWCWS